MKSKKTITKSVIILFVLALLTAVPANTDNRFDYSKYPALFYRSIDIYGNVNYRYLTKYRSELDAFTSDLKNLDRTRYETWDTKEKLAFWINIYNALTIKLVVDNYPIDGALFKAILYPRNSIKQISGAFDKRTFTVMGQPMTLDYIRDSIIRKKFADPRVHVALVSGAEGCPRLPGIPYEGETLDMWFTFQTRHILKDPMMFRTDRNKGVVYLSELFDWYGQDFITEYDTVAEGLSEFEAKERAVINYLSKHIQNNADREYLLSGNYRLEYIDFDWSLNDKKKVPLPSEVESTELAS